MKNLKLSSKDTVMLVFLVVIIIGVVYYLAFYTPLQKELSSIDQQCTELDGEISVTLEKVASMNSMQAELDEIFSKGADKVTEIAPYDNAKTVMNFLNGVLSAATEYELTFTDPEIDESGTVRRNVSLKFKCNDYSAAKSILKNLAGWNYRCLLNSITVSADGEETGVADGPLLVSATMTFFESIALQ